MPKSFSLYVHVPFCTRTCPYCSFYQVPYRAGREGAFVSAVLREAELVRGELVREGDRVETLYWGGGTPSLLTPAAADRLAAGIAATFDLEPGLEFTVEANPGELPAGTLRALRSAGANRMSLGCQSFQAERLAFLGRWHTAEDNRTAVVGAREAGFENLSLDLIFNLPPSFSAEGWRADVAEAVALAPEHLSVYGLTVEPRTVFARSAERGELALLDSDAYAEEYLWTVATLAEVGYEHYETSSFARPGRESAHNSRYWSGADYLGLGPGAHSFWNGRRWANVSSLESWLRGVESGTPARAPDEARDGEALYAEALYLGLRSRTGLAREHLRGDAARVSRFVDELERAGLIRQAQGPRGSPGEGPGEGRLVLTDPGHLVLDEIVARLLAV